MSTYPVTTLKNGLRIITDQSDSVQSAALGIWVGTGSRYEQADQNGISHFLEHMLFKGTKTRTAFDISREMEDVGGNMNAYTSREITSYHVHCLKDDVPLAADILSDMVMNSIFPEEEIERERGVILQEIGMCKDTPDDIIFDNYFETAYAKQSAGAPILGPPENIRRFTRNDLQHYIQTHYRPENIVIVAAGAVNHDDVCDLFENRMMSDHPGETAPDSAPVNYSGGEHREERELEQSHIILGFEGLGRCDNKYYTAQALSNILGGGMSSRLFQEIREKRGLVYSIFSFHQSMAETGQFGIYAGTGPQSLPELIPALCDEIQKITDRAVEEPELKRTKAQMISGLLMGQESMMNRADRLAKQLLINGGLTSLEEQRAAIEEITAQDIRDLAGQIFSTAPTLAGVGPLAALEDYETLRGRIS